MHRSIRILAMAVGLGCVIDANMTSAGDTPREFLIKYCVDCHNADTSEGDRRLDSLPTIPKSNQDIESYQDALDRIQLGDMPPEDADQPSDTERLAIVKQLQQVIEKCSKSTAPPNDAVMLRRLTREEYDRSVRALLGLQPMLKDPTSRFPPDEAVHHFHHLAAKVQLSDFLMSQYVDAAKVYLDEAISLSRRPAPGRKREAVRRVR